MVDSTSIRATRAANGAGKKGLQLGLPRLFDGPQYKKRNVIERLFSWLKEKRRICTRYDKLASSFKAMVTLACIERCMRADFSDEP
ncbi:hypothetical protein PSFL111601_16285 [Pseudomonas floridensis]